MSKQIFESQVGPHRGHAAGNTDVEKAASQLASDVKYKVSQKLGKNTKLNPAQVVREYLKQWARSSASPTVKALAKKKLIGEEYLKDIDILVEKTISNVFYKVFVEGVQKEEDNQVTEEVGEKKYQIRVTDKKTGNTYVTSATREKIRELRANPNISSVEMTKYGKPTEVERTQGKTTARVKAGKGLAKKDYDEDGTIESPKAEVWGSRARAAAKAGKPFKEEFLGEVKKKDNQPETVKGLSKGKKNNVKLFPEISEETSSIPTTATKKPVEDPKNKQETQALERTRQQEVQILQRKLQALRSAPRGTDPSIMASYEPEGDDIQEVAPPGFEGTVKRMKDYPELSKGKTKEGKEKNIYALAWWMKNKGYKSHKEETELDEAKVDAGLSQAQKREVRTARAGLAGVNLPNSSLHTGDIDRRHTHRTTDDLNKDARDIRKGKLNLPQFQGTTGRERIAQVKNAKGIAEASDCGVDEKPKLKKSQGAVDDVREIPTKVNLVKNMLRSMGLEMSYEPEGEVLDERTRARKGDPRPPRDRAMEVLRKTPSYREGGVTRGGKTIAQHEAERGVKKTPGAPTPKGETTADRLAAKKQRQAAEVAARQRAREEEDRKRRLA